MTSLTPDYMFPLTPRMECAIDEMKRLIAARFPDAAFAIYQGFEPVGIYLEARVDTDDTDEVMEVFSNRLVDIQVDERLPLYVLPTQPTGRVLLERDEHEAMDPVTTSLTPDYMFPLTRRMECAIGELKSLIAAKYPDAAFRVYQGFEPVGIRLEASVDIEDTDEVWEVVADRNLEMQVEEGLPLYVIVVQPIERVLAFMREREATNPLPPLAQR